MVLTFLGSLVVCLVVADLIVGVFHWAEDTYCRPGGRGLKGGVCDANLNHHANPRDMGATFWSRNALPIVVAGLTAAALAALGRLNWQAAVVLSLAGVANEVHFWQHSKPPAFGRVLQDMGIVQTPQHHAQHHRGDHDRRYCTLSNLLNPALDGLKIWRALEWVVARFGVKPIRYKFPKGHV